MSFTIKLQKEVKEHLKTKLLKKIEKYSLDQEDSHKPFQYALFTKKGYLVKGFIHGCETALGNWHESIAQIIAKSNFKVAKKLQRNDKIQGEVTVESERVMTNILSELDSVVREPDSKSEAAELFKACDSKNKKVEKRVQTVDLYLEKADGTEIYLEIKGPKPNKNEMRAAKRDLLEIYAMRAHEKKEVQVFLGMYYNPYYPEEYKRWTCLKFFELGGDFLVGEIFWDFLGGKGTYKKLIKIYESIGEEIRPTLERKIKSLNRQV